MPIATPEAYADMLNRAKEGGFAYPAINITSSESINAAIKGFADAGSDGIIQVVADATACDAGAAGGGGQRPGRVRGQDGRYLDTALIPRRRTARWDHADDGALR